MIDIDDSASELAERRLSPREMGKAPVRNVVAFTALIETMINRAHALPGLACFHGPSGYGKTFSATSGANEFGAYYIEMGGSWSKKSLVHTIAKEVGVGGIDKLPLHDILMQTAERMADEPYRPLIIDEADKLIEKNLIEIVRELHDKSQCVVILIGEELLPQKLVKIERVHNRILRWLPAEPCDLGDARLLARYASERIEIADDLLEVIIAKSEGRARRIAINIGTAIEIAHIHNLPRVTLSAWGNRPYYTNEPSRRRAV